MHEIGLIYQRTEDVEKMIKAFEEVVELIKLKLGKRHTCLIPVLDLLMNAYREYGMIENSDITAKEIQDICSDASNESCYNDFADAVMKVFGHVIDNSMQVTAAAAA